jgi:hypothetical protein
LLRAYELSTTHTHPPSQINCPNQHVLPSAQITQPTHQEDLAWSLGERQERKKRYFRHAKILCACDCKVGRCPVNQLSPCRLFLQGNEQEKNKHSRKCSRVCLCDLQSFYCFSASKEVSYESSSLSLPLSHPSSYSSQIPTSPSQSASRSSIPMIERAILSTARILCATEVVVDSVACTASFCTVLPDANT